MVCNDQRFTACKGNLERRLRHVLHITIFSENHYTFWSISSVLSFPSSSVSDTVMPFSSLCLSHPPFLYPTWITVCERCGTGADPYVCPVLSKSIVLCLGFGPGCRGLTFCFCCSTDLFYEVQIIFCRVTYFLRNASLINRWAIVMIKVIKDHPNAMLCYISI